MGEATTNPNGHNPKFTRDHKLDEEYNEVQKELASHRGDTHWFIHMFFSAKFRIHRVTGFAFLLCYVIAWYYYIFDYTRLVSSGFLIVVPFLGWLQSVTAIYTFTFMPKITDPGYVAMGDKSPLSYFFIKENNFFEMLLLFQYLYYLDGPYAFIRSVPAIEMTFVFLPYMLRVLWPTTRFRDAMNNEQNKTAENRMFMLASTYVVKVFYVFAKHYIGFYLNYIRYMGYVTPQMQVVVHGLLLTCSYATTVSLFLHTLRFKGYLSARSAVLFYEGSYLVVFYFYYLLVPILQARPDIAFLCFIGLLINFGRAWSFHSWQIAMLGLFHYCRANGLATGNFLAPYLPAIVGNAIRTTI